MKEALFSKQELMFIMSCVEAQQSQNTDVARVKSAVIVKLCEVVAFFEPL